MYENEILDKYIYDKEYLVHHERDEAVKFTRDSGLMGGACMHTIYIDNNKAFDIRESQAITVNLEPGNHFFRLETGTGPVFGAGISIDGQKIIIDGKQVIAGGDNCGVGETLIGFQIDGTPFCECSSDFTQCGDSCLDLMTDPENCGTCGNVCNPGLDCMQGFCRQCDVATQSCEEPGDACYANLITGLTACLPPVPENGSGMQGDDCDFTFMNTCAEGFGCVLNNAPDNTYTGLVCAKFCEFGRTYPAPCEMYAGHRCVPTTELYSNTVTDDISICVGPEWFP